MVVSVIAFYEKVIKVLSSPRMPALLDLPPDTARGVQRVARTPPSGPNQTPAK
jgi:hypothetical protein